MFSSLFMQDHIMAGMVIVMENKRDFVIKNGVLIKYRGPGGDAAIPEGITEIGSSASDGCMGLTEIAIPKGVTKIGRFALDGCTSLTDITIPGSVREIGTWAAACWPKPTIHAPVGSYVEGVCQEEQNQI